MDESDLKEMEITSEKDRATILEAASLLNNRVEKRPLQQLTSQTVDEWLDSIHLSCFKELFRRHLYTDMDRVRRVWEVELAAVLEIKKSGHRKRILASVNGGGGGAGSGSIISRSNNVYSRNGTAEPNLDELNKDLNALVSYFIFHSSS